MSVPATVNPRSLPVNRIGAESPTPATGVESAGTAWFDHLPDVIEPVSVEEAVSPLPEPVALVTADEIPKELTAPLPPEPAVTVPVDGELISEAPPVSAVVADPPVKPRKLRRKKSTKGWIEIVPDLYVERGTLRRLRLLSITLAALVGFWAVQRCVKPSMHEYLDAAFLTPSVAVSENTFPRLNAMSRQLQQLRYLEAFSHAQARTANVLRFASSVIPAGVRVTAMDVDGVTGGRCHVNIKVRCADVALVQTYIDNLRVLIPGISLSSKTKNDDDDTTYVIENGPGERS